MKKSFELKNKMVGFFGRALLIAAALGASAMLPSHSALADEETDSNMGGGSIFISSERTKTIEIAAGQTYDGEFRVENPTDTEYNVRVYAAPFTVSGQEYKQVFDQETQYTQLSRWIRFEQEVYPVAGGEEVTIPYSVVAPSNAVGGGQYAIIFAEAESVGSTIQTIPRLGYLLYAHVDGEINLAGSVVSQNIRNFYWNPPVSISAVIENSGNIDFNAHVKTSIVNFFGSGNATQPIEDDYAVMPETRRLVTQTWEDAPALGIFKIRQEITIMNAEPVVLERTVIIIPLFLLVVVAIVLVGLIIWIIAGLKKYKK